VRKDKTREEGREGERKKGGMQERDAFNKLDSITHVFFSFWFSAVLPCLIKTPLFLLDLIRQGVY
jgi:hypothetical protein